MAFAPSRTYFDCGDGSIVGCFEEVDCGNFFEFSQNDEEMTDSWQFPHKVWVTTPREGLDSGFRYARVLKTVAYIAVDEDAYGQPIVEKWSIKRHREYDRPEAA